MSKILEVRNPMNGELVGSLPLSGGAEIEAMIRKAAQAKILWANTPLYQRGEIIYKYCELVTQHTEDIARTLSMEMGKPIAQSRDEVGGTARLARGFVERANHLYGQQIPTGNQPGSENDVIFTMREPLGVMVCVIPFNYPVDLFTHKVAPALIMGNVVIVKAPSIAPLAIFKLEELFRQAGLPEGVCQFMVCTQEDSSKHLMSSPEVSAVSLTGSTRAGIEISKIGAETLKRIFLELGGNDANIILEDVKLDEVMDYIVFCRMLNNGQICCSNKRFIIHRSLQKEFVERLTAKVGALKFGDSLDETADLTCVASERAAIEVERQIRTTVEQGAKLATGGERERATIRPAVLWDVTAEMDVAADMEIFGPAFPVIPFDTEEEAIAIANRSSFGLSSGILTHDLKRALRMAPKIQAGSVVLNGCSSYRHMDQAFGGYKMSGIGREGISATLEEYSQVKNYIIQGAFS